MGDEDTTKGKFTPGMEETNNPVSGQTSSNAASNTPATGDTRPQYNGSGQELKKSGTKIPNMS